MGGVAFTRGQLYQILKNAIYIGQIPHKAQSYPGLHKAIVDRETWDRVQATLAEHLTGERRAQRAASPSLLAGLIVDEAGEPLIATHATKGKVRYRYYVSRNLHHKEGPDDAGMRIAAREIENAVACALATTFEDPLELMCRASLPLDTGAFEQAFANAGATAAKLRAADRNAVRALVRQVRVHGHGLDIDVAVPGIATALEVATEDQSAITLEVPSRLTRTGRTMRLVQADGRTTAGRQPDPTLLRLLIKASKWWERTCQKRGRHHHPRAQRRGSALPT